MNQNFPGKNAVWVSYPYSKEHSCKKAKKSYARFSGKSGNELPNYLTNNYKPNLNWRWELKRPDGHAQLQSFNLWIDRLTSWTSSTSRTSWTSHTSRLKETLFVIFNVRFSESLTCRDFLASFKLRVFRLLDFKWSKTSFSAIFLHIYAIST